METRFFAPGNLVSNLDFVETIFGNGGDPFLPENDAGLDVDHWSGHTGCVILAPHLIRVTDVRGEGDGRGARGAQLVRDGFGAVGLEVDERDVRPCGTKRQRDGPPDAALPRMTNRRMPSPPRNK